MRPTASVVLILAIGLIAAACGGSDATPEPADGATPAAATTPGAEGSGEVASQAAATEPPEPAFTKKAAQTSADDPDATHGLVSGRYRLAWDTPTDEAGDGCARVEVAVVQQDGDFEYVKSSTSARFNATVNDLPEGMYKLEQRDPECEVWQIRIDWMTN